MATTKVQIITPVEFGQQLLNCSDKLTVVEKCNELIEILKINYAPTTVRKYLTNYRKVVQSLHLSNSIDDNLLVLREFKKDGVTISEKQHCALEFLVPDDDTNIAIEAKSESHQLLRAGENLDDDEIKEPHTVDVSEVFKVAEQLLKSDNVVELALGLQVFTGRRRSENFLGKFIADDSHTMIFNGQLKQRTTQAKVADYLIPVYYSSDILEEVSERIEQMENVKSLYSMDDDKTLTDRCDNRFGTNVNNVFTKYFACFFPESPNSKTSHGSSHQLRALYAGITGYLYEKQRGSEAGKIDYIAKALGDTVAQVSAYTKFKLINVPDIKLELNLKHVGQVKEKPVKTPNFNMDLFLLNLDAESIARFEMENKNGDSLEIIFARSYCMATKSINTPCSTIAPRKPRIEVDLEICFDAIIRYNSQVDLNYRVAVRPSVIANVYEEVLGKRVFTDTVNKFLDGKSVTITQHHHDLNIAGNQNHKIRNLPGGMKGIIKNISSMIVKND
jgi:Telomere resolvase